MICCFWWHGYFLLFLGHQWSGFSSAHHHPTRDEWCYGCCQGESVLQSGKSALHTTCSISTPFPAMCMQAAFPAWRDCSVMSRQQTMFKLQHLIRQNMVSFSRWWLLLVHLKPPFFFYFFVRKTWLPMSPWSRARPWLMLKEMLWEGYVSFRLMQKCEWGAIEQAGLFQLEGYGILWGSGFLANFNH